MQVHDKVAQAKGSLRWLSPRHCLAVASLERLQRLYDLWEQEQATGCLLPETIKEESNLLALAAELAVIEDEEWHDCEDGAAEPPAGALRARRRF